MHSDIWFSDLISVQKPEYLTTPKAHCGTIETGIGKLRATMHTVPATTHNSFPSISASCSAFSIDRYLYIIPGCIKCFRDLHCNFNHKV